MAQQKKLTPMVISGIRTWVQQGLNANEIAQNIGCTVGTLRVRCSQLKISLRHRGHSNGAYTGNGAYTADTIARQAAASPPPPGQGTKRNEFTSVGSKVDRREQLLVPVSKSTVQLLQTRAALKGLSDFCLAATLLEIIAQDDLFDAVLDE